MKGKKTRGKEKNQSTRQRKEVEEERRGRKTGKSEKLATEKVRKRERMTNEIYPEEKTVINKGNIRCIKRKK